MRPRIGDVRMHVSVIGDEWRDGDRRPVIVALHGGPGVDGSGLRFLMAPASEYAQVLVPDQRGHGHSDLSDPSRWTLDTWADDLAALVDVLGLSRPVVLGTSFGGMVVQRYLARHPDQPAGAVLVSTIPRAPDEAETVERFRQLGGEPAAAAMQRSFREPTVDAEREWAEVCAPFLTRRELSPAYEEATRNAVSTTEVNLHFMPILSCMDLRPGLAAAHCPVLVLAGEHDPLSPPAVVAEIVSALPAGLGELHVVGGASHRVLWDEAETAHALVREFVQRVTLHALSVSA
jgi:pimeloyl-ACP methyl ester carboxylesterase